MLYIFAFIIFFTLCSCISTFMNRNTPIDRHYTGSFMDHITGNALPPMTNRELEEDLDSYWD